MSQFFDSENPWYCCGNTEEKQNIIHKNKIQQMPFEEFLKTKCILLKTFTQQL